MGAALTYARRYALFTLVGIAGEDDLDAPDLATPQQQSPGPERSKGNGTLNGGQLHAPYPAAGRSAAKISSVPREPALGAEASVQYRDRLLGEINELASGDEAALWAHRSLAEKNKLTATDAGHVEEAFQARLASFAVPGADKPQGSGKVAPPATTQDSDSTKKPRTKSRSKVIDKSELALPEPRRVRDRDHVRHVAKQPCLVCGRQPTDPHHLRFAQSRALGRKVGDEFVVPLCRGHHREVHRHGDEAAWWQKAVIDPTAAARALWLETHPLPTGASPTANPADQAKVRNPQRAGGRRASQKTHPAEGTDRDGIV
jgi:hypothetical protein